MQTPSSARKQTLKKEYNKSQWRRHILTPHLRCVMLHILWDNRVQKTPVRA